MTEARPPDPLTGTGFAAVAALVADGAPPPLPPPLPAGNATRAVDCPRWRP